MLALLIELLPAVPNALTLATDEQPLPAFMLHPDGAAAAAPAAPDASAAAASSSAAAAQGGGKAAAADVAGMASDPRREYFSSNPAAARSLVARLVPMMLQLHASAVLPHVRRPASRPFLSLASHRCAYHCASLVRCVDAGVVWSSGCVCVCACWILHLFGRLCGAGA